MTVEYRELDNGLILHLEFGPPAGGAEDVRLANRIMREAMEKAEKEICVIADIRKLPMRFGNLVEGLGELKSEDGQFIRDKGFTFLVGEGFMINTIAAAMSQTQYGQRRFAIVETVDEAIELARIRLQELEGQS